jgi:predicted ATPase/class 3 adenylate cyclase
MSAVAAWLGEHGFGQYATAFADQAIDIAILSDLSETDLEKLGVRLGHRKRMLRTIAALKTQPAGETSTSPERRQITVLFCDLVGSTALAAKLDPEDLSGVIRRFQHTCASVIAGHDGNLAKFMGDGILAYFGYPHAHEDDAARAVRAGLELVAKVGRLLLPCGEPLQVRVGIATGLVIVGEKIGEGASQEQAAIGETPNLAARLQSIASPNDVVIAASTRRLLASMFACEDLGTHGLKGMPESVQAWRVTGERVVESRFDATHAGRLTNFVGRQQEVQQLMSLWVRARSGEGQVALLCGEAGIGKSRTGMTLRNCIARQSHRTTRYQCSPYHHNSPLYPIIRQMEHAAGFGRTDAPETKIEKLESMVTRAGDDRLADMGLFVSLLSLPNSQRYPEQKLAPQRRKDLTIEALIRQLLGLASSRPVLCIIEDVHWADPTTIELISRAIESIKSAPILMVVTFRPEFVPPWLDRPHVTMLKLARLDRGQAGAMVFDVSGGKMLPQEIFEQILSKTDGVPLFVEELTKTVLELGLLQDAGDCYVIAGAPPTLSIPATLHDSLMARLDRLARVKDIAQIGSAIGREFSYRLLAAVASEPKAQIEEALAQLIAAELISVRGEPPDCIYTFKHALVQDAAYGSLLRAKRQELHGRIAEVLQQQFPRTAATQPELMAHHLAQAGRTDSAIEYLRIAGQHAIQRSANAEAIGHVKRALDLLQPLPANADKSHKALGLEVMLGQAMIAGLGYAARETREVLLRAKTHIDASTEPAQIFSVLYGIWACYYVGGEVEMQRVAAAEFLAEAERIGDRGAICLSHRALGTTYVQLGDFATGRRHLEQARALYDPALHAGLRYQYGQDIGAAAACYLCWALWHLGYVDQAAKIAAEAIEHADAVAHPHTLVYTICHARGMLDIFRRRPDELRSHARFVVSLCAEHGFPFWGAGGRILDGWATISKGRVYEGLMELRQGLNAWRHHTGARLWLPIFLALQAEGYAKAGESDKALRLIDEALAISDETGERWALAEVLRMKAALLLAVGETPASEIEALLLRSFSTARHQQARCWELRTAGDLARLWHARGRSAEALSLVSSSYNQFDEGHGTPELQDARALIETLRQAISTKQPQRGERRSEHDAAMPAAVLKFDGAVVGGAKWARELSFSGVARPTSH